MHWHLAAEWGYMSYGNCRVTVLDEVGRIYISDVKEGDIWYFPSGLPHSLQGLGPGGCEFILCFDDGKASEFNTLLLTDWVAHTPPEILALNFGVPAEAFSKIPLHNLWIFQGQLPASLEADRAAATGAAGAPPYPFTFSLAGLKPVKQTKGGEVRIADSTNFTMSKSIAAALVTIHPGGLREMHWHPNADEWQYWLKGKGRMGVFDTGPNAKTTDFNPGDIGYVKRNHGHYIKNTGDTDLQMLEVFRSDHFANISLSDWLAHTPPEMVAQTLNVDAAVIARFPKNAPAVMPE
jgi:oxalate decarboxylase